MKNKITLIIIMTFLLILSTTALVSASKPVYIARLPIIIAQNLNPDKSTLSSLDMKIARSLIVPGDKKAAEYIPTTLSKAALQDIWIKMYRENQRANPAEAMKKLASAVNADVVISMILYKFNQEPQTPNINANLKSEAAVALIIYDKRKDELIDEHYQLEYNNKYTVNGTADYLSQECLNNLLNTINLREKVFGKAQESKREEISRKEL